MSDGGQVVLTKRQTQILCLAAYPNKQIAVRLQISRKTVRNHFTDIFDRLLGHESPGRTRNKALLRALRLGLIKLDEIAYGRPIMERGKK